MRCLSTKAIPSRAFDRLPEPIVSLIACQADNRIAPLSFVEA